MLLLGYKFSLFFVLLTVEPNLSPLLQTSLVVVPIHIMTVPLNKICLTILTRFMNDFFFNRHHPSAYRKTTNMHTVWIFLVFYHYNHCIICGITLQMKHLERDHTKNPKFINVTCYQVICSSIIWIFEFSQRNNVNNDRLPGLPTKIWI